MRIGLLVVLLALVSKVNAQDASLFGKGKVQTIGVGDYVELLFRALPESDTSTCCPLRLTGTLLSASPDSLELTPRLLGLAEPTLSNSKRYWPQLRPARLDRFTVAKADVEEIAWASSKQQFDRRKRRRSFGNLFLVTGLATGLAALYTKDGPSARLGLSGGLQLALGIALIGGKSKAIPFKRKKKSSHWL